MGIRWSLSLHGYIIKEIWLDGATNIPQEALI